MRPRLLLLAVLALAAPPASAQTAKELVGTYQMEVANGDILELRGDGTAVLGGEAARWSARGNTLRIGEEAIPYTLREGRLLLTIGGVPVAWKKLPASAGAAKAARPGQGKASSPAPGATAGTAQDDQARQVLTSSAWCSFTYNKVSGASSTRRVVFGSDGVLSVAGGGETYSSGYGGTYAGQSRTATTMRWRVKDQRLFIDQGGGLGYQDVGLTATRNSSGAIILHADGREYARCN